MESPPHAVEPDAAGSARSRVWPRALALVAITCAAYWPALHAGFVWDDDYYVTRNPTLRDADGLRRIWFEVGATPQYYPLVHTTFWVEYHLWGLSPAGYHAVNVALHTVVALLIWRALLAIGVPGAWWAAAIFALHPVHVESVAWITERKNVLSATFYFAAMLLLVRRMAATRHASSESHPAATEQPQTRAATVARASSEPRASARAESPSPSGSPMTESAVVPPADAAPTDSPAGWTECNAGYVVAVALFVLALLSKTVTCSLPAAVLLIVWWKRGRVILRHVLTLAPMFALGLAFGLLTAWMEADTVGAAGEEWDHTWIERCLIAGRAVLFYPWKLVWPSTLTFFYPRWQIDATQVSQFLAPLAVIAALAALWRGRRWWGTGPLAAVLCFVGTLFPALGFIDVYPTRYSYVADHFQYHASPYLIALLTAAVYSWFGSSSPLASEPRASARADSAAETRSSRRSRAARTVDRFLGAVRDSIQQFRSAMAEIRHQGTSRGLKPAARWTVPDALLRARGKVPEIVGAIALTMLAVLTWRQCHVYADLETLWRDTIGKNPDAWMAHNNLGSLLHARGDIEEAVEHYQTTLRLRPDDVEAHYNLGRARAAQGRHEQAILHFRAVLEARPDHSRAEYGLGLALRRMGREAEAVEDYRRAVQLDPDFAEAHFALGIALRSLGRTEEAIAAYRAAIAADPGLADAHNNLAAALEAAGRVQEAIAHYLMAVELRPDFNTARRNLADLLAGQGRLEPAIEHYRAALQSDPTDATAMRGAAWIMATTREPALRDPETALMLAERANELTNGSDPAVLDALAAAAAASGDFDRAVHTAERAARMAGGAGRVELADAIRARVEVYRSGRAWVEP
ncbi:MAG: tetratricopeptide repeat protein [Phycisphaerales bacterium]|nr:MAG: tetratricopeptide repeat protein [Phycisphaerales bacterium]